MNGVIGYLCLVSFNYRAPLYVVVLTLIRIIKSVVTGQAPVTLELRNTPGKNTNQRWCTHVLRLTQFMPPPETYKSEIESQPTMCQVHTSAYVSLLAPGKTDYTAWHLRKTTTYILHVVPITYITQDYHVYIARSTYHYAYARLTQVNWKRETKENNRR